MQGAADGADSAAGTHSTTGLMVHMARSAERSATEAALCEHEARMLASLRARGLKVEGMADAMLRQHVAAVAIQCHVRARQARAERARLWKAAEIEGEVAALRLEMDARAARAAKSEAERRGAVRPPFKP